VAQNAKTSKLIRRFSRATRRDPEATKKWFDGLNHLQRAEATKMMRTTLGENEAK
jgi:hypothetical protein